MRFTSEDIRSCVGERKWLATSDHTFSPKSIHPCIRYSVNLLLYIICICEFVPICQPCDEPMTYPGSTSAPAPAVTLKSISGSRRWMDEFVVLFCTWDINFMSVMSSQEGDPSSVALPDVFFSLFVPLFGKIVAHYTDCTSQLRPMWLWFWAV